MLLKERVSNAIAHQETDIVPYQFHFTPDVLQDLETILNTDDVYKAVRNHISQFTVGSIYGIVSEDIGENKRRDEWGVEWQTIPETSAERITEHPLKTPSLKGYQFPDPNSPGRLVEPSSRIDWDSGRFVLCCIGSLFETAYTLRGMEDLFVDMSKDINFVHDLLEAILEFDISIFDLTMELDYPIDGISVADDYGTQSSLMISPKMWRTFIKPRLAAIVDRAHAAGLPFFLHSDGNISALLTDLVEIGVDVIHPVQEEAMDVQWVKKEYGKDLCLYGCIGEQGVFSFGTPDQVIDDVRQKIELLGRGGGFILSPGIHTIKQVPIENVLAVIETVNNQVLN